MVERSKLNTDHTFLLKLLPQKKIKFQSGDLINIIPDEEKIKRQYSIAKTGKAIVLSIKKHNNGKCSSYINRIDIGQEITATIQKNPKFHLPNNNHTKLLISNGTGIASFLGMIAENKNKTPLQLYWRRQNRSLFRPLQRSY